MMKTCGACLKELSKDNYSKKQWQQKQFRRCKDCIDANREIQTNLSVLASDSTPAKKDAKKEKAKNAPTFAGSQEAMRKPSTGETIVHKVASDFCSWCGRAEENEPLLKCAGCRNILYCSRACQRAAFPEHKLVCNEMNKDRKEAKKEKKAGEGGTSFSITEASGTGSVAFSCNSVGNKGCLYMMSYSGELRGYESAGSFFATDESERGILKLFGTQKFRDFKEQLKLQTFAAQGSLKRTEFFTDVEELSPIDQFLLSCGPSPNIERAKSVLPVVLHQISISGLKPDGSIPNIGDITVRGYNLNALEWASRRGNYDIAEWLATDPRTKIMVSRSDSAPVAWACYTNKIELAKMLVKHGANTHSTTEVVFGYKPALHLAVENGQLLAVKYLVEECGHDIFELDRYGDDVCSGLRKHNRVWQSVAGCVAADKYAKTKMAECKKKPAKKNSPSISESSTLSLEDKLATALKKLQLAGGREDELDEDDETEDDPRTYLNELLVVADARYALAQYDKAGDDYYRAYYAAMHTSNVINNPKTFPIAHKMIQAWMKSEYESCVMRAHGMAQQTCMMPGHPSYLQQDLKEVEKVMRQRGMKIQRFGNMMGGFGF